MCYDRYSMKSREALNNFLAVIIIFTGLVSIAFSLFYFYSLDTRNDFSKQIKPVEAEVLTPTKIISRIEKYNNQTVTVRGVTDQEAVVCEKRECPAGDSCCGCPQTKNLILTDPGIILENKLQSQLTLLGVDLEPLCRRQEKSCQYLCSDWVRGALYDATGIFHGEKQLGLSVVVNLNFQVQNKEMVKNLNFFDSIGRFFEILKQALGQFKTSGSFVNH